jgi:hypothetical protein
MSWQYNGCAKWIDVVNWCRENLCGCWHTNGFETIHFNSEKDYAWFMLRWS